MNEGPDTIESASLSLDGQQFAGLHADYVPTVHAENTARPDISSSPAGIAPDNAADTFTLEKRVRALETVVELERKLRRVKEMEVQELLGKSQAVAAPAETVSSEARVLVPAAPEAMFDDDMTVLHVPSAVPAVLPASGPATEPSTTTSGISHLLAPAVPGVDDILPPAGPAESGTDMLALPLGFHLLEYRIDSVLGRGGFGITYLATDIHLNVKVAIKEYLPGDFAYRASDKSVTPRWPEDREFYQHGLESFLVEARTLATFRHPNIVRVARFFEAHRTAYMVLEYERGKPLKEWWPRHKTMQEADLLLLLQPLLEGLAVVHGTGYLHRDIKPDNIYVRHEDGSLVLLDFGAARQASGERGKLANVVTPGYAPCEQYEGGDEGPATDIYALGASLYWMITGAKPMPAPERRIQDGMLPAVQAGSGRYSTEFLQAIDWALKLDAKDRPQDLAAFRQALFAAHAGSLSWQDALRSGDNESLVGESWRTLLESPKLLKSWLSRAAHAAVRPASWPMVVKMTLAMVLAALLPMLIVAYYNLNATMETVSASELRNLEQHAQSSAGRLSQLINDSRNLATYLGTDQDFVSFLEHPGDAGKASLDSKLAGLAKSNPDVHPLIVMDKDGNALVSNDVGVTGRNFKFREYFKEAMAGRKYMTGMVVGATAGAAGVYYSNPVVGADGTVIGAVVLRIKGSSIASILADVHRANLVPFLVDGDGVLIYHPDQNLLYRSLMPVPPATLKQIVADQRFRRDSIQSLNMPDLAKAMTGAKEAGNISYFSSISKAGEIAGYAPVRGHNWVVGMTEKQDSFEQPLNRLFTNVLYSVIVVGVVFMLLAVWFARSIVRPIERLTVAAHALKSGDYEKANIKVTSNDELGRLARTFNVMIDVLRQRDREQQRRKTGQRGDDAGVDKEAG
ncbi:protein kinase domain-containing protein [Undibacterium sp. TJN25]|uniref:protein kinase domain-containing protein n=1 Tax=Undibacterium sp. TJN25 TaxID=3413056 RepID=UPI003BF43367